MRKIIICFLLLAMVCGLLGCGKKVDDTTAPIKEYSAEDLLISQALVFAQQTGTAVTSDYLEMVGITGSVAKQAQIFSATASPANTSSALILPVNGRDLDGLIQHLNGQLNSSDQRICSNLLTFSSQFHSPKEISGDYAVQLTYNNRGNILVYFEPQENNLVKATVYPLFPATSHVLMTQYFSDAESYNKKQIMEAISLVGDVSCVAAPTGSSMNEGYYLALARTILSDVTAVSIEDLKPHVSDNALLSQVSKFTSALAGDAVSGSVYRFPPQLEESLSRYNSKLVQNLARQQMYPSWTNHVSATFGDTYVSANAIINEVIITRNPGAAASKSEAPVLVALDFGGVTALVTLYPNEYNTYLYSIACLPCNLQQAASILLQMGATKM